VIGSNVSQPAKQDGEMLGKQIDCTGKFILPGYIDTHIHFFQSGDLFTRPDVADFNNVHPYKDEVAWIKSHLDDVFARYLRSGITSVIDVGGPFWSFEVRKIANTKPKAPRVSVAGPLISSVSRDKLDLGDPPIVKIETPAQARDFARKLGAQKPGMVKIWYIVDKDHSVDSFRPIVRATIDESHAIKLRPAPPRFALLRSALTTYASLRSGVNSGFFCRQSFHTATPCRMIWRCSSLATEFRHFATAALNKKARRFLGDMDSGISMKPDLNEFPSLS
jgi:hypothetical protein